MGQQQLTLLILATVFAQGLTINCYHRTATSTGNGSSITCSAPGSFCFSYSTLGSLVSLAGCGSEGTCNYPSCMLCTSDYCNSVAPSAISCFTRSSKSTGNGTLTQCATGISSCFSQFSPDNFGGCGKCTVAASVYYGCRECRTDSCNTQTPSSISCYNRQASSIASLSNGNAVPCPTGATSCFADTSGEAACGPCTSVGTANFSCVACSTDNCNTKRLCYWASGLPAIEYLTNREPVRCGSATHCYWYTSTYGSTTHYYSGCNGCSSISNSNCRNCSTDLCNSIDPTTMDPLVAATISCYARTSATPSTSNGGTVACSNSVSGCYSNNNGEAGCGSCTAADALSSGCVACQHSRCNTRRLCYARNASSSSASISICSSSASCYNYTVKLGSNSHYYAGCGDCGSISGSSISASSDCKSCTSDLCNAASSQFDLSSRVATSGLVTLAVVMKLLYGMASID